MRTCVSACVCACVCAQPSLKSLAMLLVNMVSAMWLVQYGLDNVVSAFNMASAMWVVQCG